MLTILKLCLLALLYLFFFRVLRAVWADLRAAGAAAPTGRRQQQVAAVAPAPAAVPAPGPAPAPPKRGVPTELVVVEGPARGAAFAIGRELTIGRAGGCAIALPDDTFVSSLHARVFRDAGGAVLVEDLGSTNGTTLNGAAVGGPAPLARGDKLKVGGTTLEARG